MVVIVDYHLPLPYAIYICPLCLMPINQAESQIETHLWSRSADREESLERRLKP